MYGAVDHPPSTLPGGEPYDLHRGECTLALCPGSQCPLAAVVSRCGHENPASGLQPEPPCYAYALCAWSCDPTTSAYGGGAYFCPRRECGRRVWCLHGWQLCLTSPRQCACAGESG